MGNQTVTLIPGDGVWPELIGCVKEVFAEVAAPVEFEEVILSEIHSRSPTEDLNKAMESLRRNKVGIKGIITSPAGKLVQLLRSSSVRPGISGLEGAMKF